MGIQPERRVAGLVAGVDAVRRGNVADGMGRVDRLLGEADATAERAADVDHVGTADYGAGIGGIRGGCLLGGGDELGGDGRERAAAVESGGAGIGAPAVLPGSPAAAKVETVTPTQARVIFDSLWADTKSGQYRHLDGAAKVYAEALLNDLGIRGIRQPVTEVAIGIPSRQFGYPAYFVANAQFAAEAAGDKGARAFYSMLRREAADQPWHMVEFRFGGLGNAIPVPKILPDGHLAPLPAVADLKLDPSGVGAAYATWYSRAAAAKKLPVDQQLSLPPEESAQSVLYDHVGSAGRHDRVFSVITSRADATQPVLIPLDVARP